jgi:hypothetical protein
MSGFSGDVVTVDATTDEGWYLSAIALTGAEATGFKFMFTGSDVTAQGEYTDVGFPVTYLADEHVSVDGPSIYIPGQSGITLDSGYDTYYRISGYDIENGSINEEGLLIPTGPCTIRAVETPNYFTATGNFEKGSNVSKKDGSISVRKYALYVGHTGDIPTSWYATSNHWNPSNASSYSITLNSRMLLGADYSANTKANAITARACTIINGSYTNTAGTSYTGAGKNPRFTYSKNITTTTMSDYSISGYAAVPKIYHPGTAVYIATGTNGTWTATGIAP